MSDGATAEGTKRYAESFRSRTAELDTRPRQPQELMGSVDHDQRRNPERRVRVQRSRQHRIDNVLHKEQYQPSPFG